jgi:hypothetical protein
VESKLGPLGTSATEWPIVPAPGDYDDGELGGIKIVRGNRSTRRKHAPAQLCPPQIPTWPDLGSNPGRRGGKPATNRLSYGADLPMDVSRDIQQTLKSWDYGQYTWKMRTEAVNNHTSMHKLSENQNSGYKITGILEEPTNIQG